VKTFLYIIGAVFVLKMFTPQQPSAAATLSPQDVLQAIRDQNLQFWAAVGAPWEADATSPDFSPGFSAQPFSDPGFNGT
jgi:hypothetical protein